MISLARAFVWTCVLVCFVNANLPFGHPQHHGLANLLFGSKDPHVAFVCFGDYIAKLNTTGVEYKQNYTACLREARESRQKVEKEMVTNRRALAQTASEICAGWERCNRNYSTLDVFLCHAKEGSEKAKDAYSITDRADEFVKELSGKYHDISSRQESCCKLAERKYAQECSNLYQNLKICLRGHSGTEVVSTTPESWPETTVDTPTEVVGPQLIFGPPV